MRVRDIVSARRGAAWVSSALIAWEDSEQPDFALYFEIGDPNDHSAGAVNGLAAACFPLAIVHRERRLRIDGALCPMLADGLRAIDAWWGRWGGTPREGLAIEAMPAQSATRPGAKAGISLLSGGVDSLHTLYRNRELYQASDPAFIRTSVFVHGYDIGKRPRDAQSERYRLALDNLRPLADMMDVRLVTCRTNLRHVPTPPGFWTFRQHGGALAAVGHMSAVVPSFVFIAGAYDIARLTPLGAHAAIDGWYSSQDVSTVFDGATFNRIAKLRDLAGWPEALERLRVCPANLGRLLNCGVCSTCVHTRLELFGLGIDYTVSLGESLVPPGLLERAAQIDFFHETIRYRDILRLLRARGLVEHCRIIEGKLAACMRRGPRFWAAPGCGVPPHVLGGEFEHPQVFEDRSDLPTVDRV